MKRKTTSIATTLLILAIARIAHASEPGWFGLTFTVEGEGLFTRTILSASVVSIAPDSPAAKSTIHVGDQLLEIENIPLAGQQPRTISALIHKSPGETLHLRLKHVTGEAYEVVLTASPRPK